MRSNIALQGKDQLAAPLRWRKSFPRPQAVEAVREAALKCKLPGVTLLPEAPVTCG